MAKQNNGGSTPKIPPTPEEQQLIKRAAQERSRANRSPRDPASRTNLDGGFRWQGNNKPASPLAEAVKAKQKMDELAAKQAERETRDIAFRTTQVEIAAEQAAFASLVKGSPAWKVALEAILAFPTIKVDPKGKKRTAAAIDHAISLLTPEEQKRTKAISRGRSVVYDILTVAYKEAEIRVNHPELYTAEEATEDDNTEEQVSEEVMADATA